METGSHRYMVGGDTMKGIIDNDKSDRFFFAFVLLVGVIAWTLAIGAVPAEPQGLTKLADSTDKTIWVFSQGLSRASGPAKGWESR